MSDDDVTKLAKAISDLAEVVALHQAALQSLTMRLDKLTDSGGHSVKA